MVSGSVPTLSWPRFPAPPLLIIQQRNQGGIKSMAGFFLRIFLTKRNSGSAPFNSIYGYRRRGGAPWWAEFEWRYCVVVRRRAVFWRMTMLCFDLGSLKGVISRIGPPLFASRTRIAYVIITSNSVMAYLHFRCTAVKPKLKSLKMTTCFQWTHAVCLWTTLLPHPRYIGTSMIYKITPLFCLPDTDSKLQLFIWGDVRYRSLTCF